MKLFLLNLQLQLPYSYAILLKELAIYIVPIWSKADFNLLRQSFLSLCNCEEFTLSLLPCINVLWKKYICNCLNLIPTKMSSSKFLGSLVTLNSQSVKKQRAYNHAHLTNHQLIGPPKQEDIMCSKILEQKQVSDTARTIITGIRHSNYFSYTLGSLGQMSICQVKLLDSMRLEK